MMESRTEAMVLGITWGESIGKGWQIHKSVSGPQSPSMTDDLLSFLMSQTRSPWQWKELRMDDIKLIRYTIGPNDHVDG